MDHKVRRKRLPAQSSTNGLEIIAFPDDGRRENGHGRFIKHHAQQTNRARLRQRVFYLFESNLPPVLAEIAASREDYPSQTIYPIQGICRIRRGAMIVRSWNGTRASSRVQPAGVSGCRYRGRNVTSPPSAVRGENVLNECKDTHRMTDDCSAPCGLFGYSP